MIKLVSFVRLLYIAGSKILCQNKNLNERKYTTRNLINYILKKRHISKPKYRIVKNIINNVPSYSLTSEEEYALSFSLDRNISTKNNPNNIKTEFESFFYYMQKHPKNIDQELQSELKTKTRRT